MGAMCGCNSSNTDIIGFWRNIQLRKITFDAYQKIYEKNQRKWLSSGDNKRSVDLRKCEELYPLLDSSDFTDKQRTVYFDKLNEYINEQSDKLTFFTSLAFFTKVTTEENPQIRRQADNLLDSLNLGEKPKIHDHLFCNLIKMAIKRNDHDDVTKFFIEFVTEFPLEFTSIEKKDREEKLQIYSQANRDKLFSQIKMMNSQKFYDYMFNRDNVSLIHNDLLKIHLDYASNELKKVRTGANVENRNTPTPTPENK